MKLRKDRRTYVFDVVFEDTGEQGKVTFDSGAGVSLWPKDKLKSVKLLTKTETLENGRGKWHRDQKQRP